MRTNENPQWEVALEGPLQGHKCSVRNVFGKGYVAWKRYVRLQADLAKVPQELDPNGKYRVTTEIWWKGRAKIDTENVQKATIDGLFKRDRRILEIHGYAYEVTGKEEARIKIEKLL